jgi:oligoendopeptidase F
MEWLMSTTVPARSKVDKKFTWNAESVFPSEDAWEKEVNQILEDTVTVKG